MNSLVLRSAAFTCQLALRGTAAVSRRRGPRVSAILYLSQKKEVFSHPLISLLPLSLFLLSAMSMKAVRPLIVLLSSS